VQQTPAPNVNDCQGDKNETRYFLEKLPRSRQTFGTNPNFVPAAA
jgi:hypothetical protein